MANPSMGMLYSRLYCTGFTSGARKKSLQPYFMTTYLVSGKIGVGKSACTRTLSLITYFLGSLGSSSRYQLLVNLRQIEYHLCHSARATDPYQIWDGRDTRYLTRAAGAERAEPLAAGGAPSRARTRPRPLPAIGRGGGGASRSGPGKPLRRRKTAFPASERAGGAAAVGGLSRASLRFIEG